MSALLSSDSLPLLLLVFMAVSLLPFALAGVISLINPDLLSLLWTDPAGRAISLGAPLMMAAGILVMRQMVRVRA